MIVDYGALSDDPEVAAKATPARINNTPAPAGMIRRLLCDEDLHLVVVNSEWFPIDVGYTRRTATEAQRAALGALHDTCVWPGCETGFSECHVHHVRFWSDHGPTDLANLVPVCSHHHHLIHDDGYRLTIDADRTVHVHNPSGLLLSSVPHTRRQGTPAGTPRAA